MLRYVLRLGVELVCVRAFWLQQSELTESWGFVTSHLTTGGQSVHPSFVSSPSFHLWPYIHPLKINGQYIYHLFNTQQFYVLPTQCIYVFCVDLRTNSDYFTIQHWLVGFITEMQRVHWAVRTEFVNTFQFRRSVASLSSERPGLNPRPVHVRFMVDTVALWQVSVPVLRSSPFITIPPLFYARIRLNVALTRRTKGRRLSTFQKAVIFRKSRSIG